MPLPTRRMNTACSRLRRRSWYLRFGVLRRRFSSRDKRTTLGQNDARLMQADTTSARPAPGMIGRYWRKSPPNTITFPPKGLFGRHNVSRNVRSTASDACLWSIPISSTKIAVVVRSKVARSKFGGIPDVLCESTRMGIFRRESAVHPKGISVAAIPVVASARAILLSPRNLANNAFYKYVLPVPPCPFAKNRC